MCSLVWLHCMTNYQKYVCIIIDRNVHVCIFGMNASNSATWNLQSFLQIHDVTFGHLLFDLLFLQEYSEKVLQFNGMSALITLPKTGFYLGDSLVVSGRVENPSNTSKKVKVGLRVVRVSLFFREFYPLATVWDLELIWLWIDFAPTMQSLPRLHMTLYLWSGKGKVPML